MYFYVTICIYVFCFMLYNYMYLYFLTGSARVNIGGILVGEQWRWLSNNDVIDENGPYWGGTQPNGGENCLASYPGGVWQDSGCQFTRGYICELQP
jgi:hypothetical protein